jgi:ketosteroid isomerase-like protein
MSKANIHVVKDGFEQFFAGDIPGFLKFLSDDVYWDHRGPEVVPFNRLYRGRANVVEFFKVLRETQEASIFEPRDFFAAEDRVVCLGFFRYKVHATKKRESDFAIVFTVQNEKISHWRLLFDMAAEAAAFQA